MIRLALTALFTMSLMVVPLGSASADVGNCSDNPDNKYSETCITQSMQAGPWGGLFARWNSGHLAISQARAQEGHFFLHAIWLYSHWNTSRTFLELGDIAGISGLWERWFYWIDGTVGYMEHLIRRSPDDDLQRSYQIQWEGSGPQQGWKLHINFEQVAGYSATTPVIPWIPATEMASQKAFAGLETTNGAFALLSGQSQTHTVSSSGLETFRTDSLQLRSTACCSWNFWASSLSQVDGPQPCPVSPPYACYNGENISGGPSTWNANKPR